MDYRQSYQEWCKSAEDEQTQSQLRSMSEDQIKEAFSGELSFGTAGLRGIMAPGTACMNNYTVFRATEGLARYMQAHNMHSCAITYDSRNNSKSFCQLAAATLAEHGMRVYLTPECMPTPFLSFMVRELKCDVGVNVTASHNPSQYNGYKVYDSSGCQLLDEAADEVTRFIDGVRLFEKPLPRFEQYEGNAVQYTDKLLEEMYIDRVLQERLTFGDLDLVAVYTPLNGAGYRVVPETLRRLGIEPFVVAEQAQPDGNFPTCPYPNPEKDETLALAMRLGSKCSADIIIANDPDCDRLGVAARQGESFKRLTGNEVGVLLADFILQKLSEANDLPQNAVLVKTIVTTPMLNEIAKFWGAEVTDVLTGFKYIGNVIAKLEQQSHPERYVFGFEESCGYLKGSYVRDKDGVVAAMLVAECAACLKAQGKTLVSRLNELYGKFGHFLQSTVSYRFDGLSGSETKQRLLDELHAHPFEALGQSPVVDLCDFLTQKRYDLPRADVLRFVAADGSQLLVRPSGTEPLVKCYITVKGTEQTNQQRFAAVKAQTDKFFAQEKK